jgi:hypothetical protein
MTLLAELPWLWCGAQLPGTGPATTPDMAHLIVAPDENALADAAKSMSAPLCVLVLPDIHPWPEAGTLSPDLVLTASGRPLLYPARNALTGDCAPDHGLWVLSPALVAAEAGELLSGAPSRTLAPLVPPSLAATWDCGTSPEAAFRAGHAAMQDAPRGAALALTASLGADRPNGVWWGIGAARALLGDSVDAAWAQEEAEPTDTDSLTLRRVALARQVRVQCGLPVHPLDADAAAALRLMRASVASDGIWDRHVADLHELMPGATDAPVIEGYRLARAALWGPG